MARQRRSVLWVTLLCLVAIASPPSVVGANPQHGTLGAGLHAVAAGKAPDRSIISRTRDGVREVAVAVELTGEPDTAVRGRLRAAGLDLRGAWRRTIEGYVRPRQLERLATTPGVVAVRAIRTPIADSFVGPGPALHGATAWHQTGFTGKGVKVGILDVGFDGFAARLGTELPASVQALCFPDLGVSSPNLADCAAGETHGTAVAESIVDLAPGADLFVSNASSPADLAAAIAWMTGNGVRIINYSKVSSYLMDGMGDGTSTYFNSDYALLDAAVAGGALFVASAGNSGETTWTGAPQDLDADGWIDFVGPDELNEVTLRAGEEISVALRWPSATSDYDLLLWQGDTLVASSEELQAETGDPFEIVTFESLAGGTYDLSVWHGAGPEAALLKLLMWAPGAATMAHFTKAGSLPTPADSRNPGMVSVGAVDYRTPTVIEPYSSQGPTLDGRVKPDLVAADCAPTTIDAEFCGTSQSAPFVTGAAALLLEADPSLTPATLAALLKQRAIPLGSPVPNNVFGSGRLSMGPTPIAAPAAAAFVSPPASGTAAGPLLGQPTVAIVDADGRVAATGPGATMEVALGLAANPTGATFTCAGGTTRAAVNGVAAFSGCSVDLAGTGYTIRADVPSLASATSAPFMVAAPGAAPQVSLAVSPATVTFGKAIVGTIGVALPEGAGVPATFEWSIDLKTWAAAADVVLDPTGTGRASAVPRRHRYWRARTALSDGSVAVSAAILVRVNATATLASSVPSGRTITRTTRITLTETIRPVGSDVVRGRARFDLFLQVGTKWVRKRTLYAYASASTGRARIVTTLPSAGRWWVRSRAESTATNGASIWTSGVKYRVP
ncbi:MAG: S8 family serine peptidase [Chloroflexota bacterium]